MSIYSDKLKSPKWQKKRLEIFDRDNWTCKYCADTESTLNVHHLSYVGDPWDVKNDELITVCEDCHLAIEYCKKAYEGLKITSISKLEMNDGCCFLMIHIGNFIAFGKITDKNYEPYFYSTFESFKKIAEFVLKCENSAKTNSKS